METDCLRFQVGRIPFFSVFQLILGFSAGFQFLEFLVYFSQPVLGLIVALPGHDEATPCGEAARSFQNDEKLYQFLKPQ